MNSLLMLGVPHTQQMHEKKVQKGAVKRRNNSIKPSLRVHDEDRKEEREEEKLDHGLLKHAPEVSKRQLKSFMGMMEPTSRRQAEIAYQRLVADPKNAPLTGIPMSVAGVAPHSVKIRLRSKLTFTVGSIEPAAEQTIVSLMACGGPQQEDSPVSFANYIGNQLPKVINIAAPAGDVFTPGTMAVVTEFNPGGAGIQTRTIGYAVGTGGDATAPGLLDTNAIGTPNPGLLLKGTMGRMIAQEVEFFPNSPALVTGGTVTAIQSIDSGTKSLNNKTTTELFDMQGVTAEVFSLAGWDSDDRLRMVWVPNRPQDFNWLPADWTNFGPFPVSGLPNGEWGCSSEVWGAFCLEGVKVNLSAPVVFTVVIYSDYEFVNGAYAFATPNVASGKGLELGSGLGKHLPPAKVSGRPKINQTNEAIHAGNGNPTSGDGAVVQYMAEDMGPKHALGTVAHAQEGSFGKDLGNFAMDILPELLGFLL